MQFMGDHSIPKGKNLSQILIDGSVKFNKVAWSGMSVEKTGQWCEKSVQIRRTLSDYHNHHFVTLSLSFLPW